MVLGDLSGGLDGGLLCAMVVGSPTLVQRL